MKSFVVCFALLIGWMASPVFATTVTFEGLLPGAGSFYNGDSGIGNNANGWTADGVFFNNTFTDFGGGFTGWTGWSYSNIVDTATPGFGNQYASSTGGGANGVGGTNVGETYAIGFGDGAFFNVPSAMMVSSVDLTNTTYARLSMLTGDAFAKQFGGPSTNDPDFFRVTLTGFSAPGGSSGGGVTTGSVTVDLADYTFADNSNDFVLNTWQNVDLSQFRRRTIGRAHVSHRAMSALLGSTRRPTLR